MSTLPCTLSKDRSKWVVAQGDRYNEFKTKREALAEIADREKQADWETRLLAMDATGEYTFTPEQESEIETLTQALRDNITRYTLSGPKSIRDMSVKEHGEELRCIESWNAWQPVSDHGKLICAEIRMRQCARVEAFKRAGLSFMLSAN